MKKALAGAVVFLVAAYVFALPYITVYQIRLAVDERDSEALSEHIDFPSVRQNLKDQMSAMLLGKVQEDSESNSPLAVLGMAFAGSLVDKLLDAYITPAGVAQLLAGEKPSRKKAKQLAYAAASSTESAAPIPEDKKDAEQKKVLSDVSLGYKSTSRFEVKDNKKGMRVVLRRQGLEWKVAQIILPEMSEANPEH
ncbi:MAG TPA: DUF2939 domain-containing protein [Pseudomonadales bacterium]|jgi:hypothetical protein|nr:DUF2939 domain-containing protein [Pseudomonadales bacterium]HNL91376.1 DUF2939 domain-containing protein [Pseudomonadales bacterium]